MNKNVTKREKLEKEWQEALGKAMPIRLSSEERADLRRAYFAAAQGKRCNFVIGGPIDQSL